VCQEGFFFDDGSALAGEPHLGENVERQRRLYTLLRNNKQVLERYLLTVVANEAASFVCGRRLAENIELLIFSTPVRCLGVRGRVVDTTEGGGEPDKYLM
jgi:hypothetical protein